MRDRDLGVAIDDDGDAVFTWQRFDGANNRIQALARSAAGALSAVQTLSDAGQNAFNPQVAIDADGDAVFTWERFDGTNIRVQARTRSAAGALSPVQTLSAPGRTRPAPGRGRHRRRRGLHLAALRRDDIRVQARARSAAGALSPVQTLSNAGQNATAPRSRSTPTATRVHLDALRRDQHPHPGLGRPIGTRHLPLVGWRTAPGRSSTTPTAASASGCWPACCAGIAPGRCSRSRCNAPRPTSSRRPDPRRADHLLASDFPDGERLSGGDALPPLLRLLPGGRFPAAACSRFPRLTERGYRSVAAHPSQLSRPVRPPEATSGRAGQRARAGLRARRGSEVLRLEHEVLDQRSGTRRGSRARSCASRLPSLLAHVTRGTRARRDLHVVGHDDRARPQPAALEDPLQVGQVGVLVVVDEHEVERARREPVLGSSASIVLPPSPSVPTTTVTAVADAGVVEDAPRDLGVRLDELDRVQVGVRRASRARCAARCSRSRSRARAAAAAARGESRRRGSRPSRRRR